MTWNPHSKSFPDFLSLFLAYFLKKSTELMSLWGSLYCHGRSLRYALRPAYVESPHLQDPRWVVINLSCSISSSLPEGGATLRALWTPLCFFLHHIQSKNKEILFFPPHILLPIPFWDDASLTRRYLLWTWIRTFFFFFNRIFLLFILMGLATRFVIAY